MKERNDLKEATRKRRCVLCYHIYLSFSFAVRVEHWERLLSCRAHGLWRLVHSLNQEGSDTPNRATLYLQEGLEGLVFRATARFIAACLRHIQGSWKTGRKVTFFVQSIPINPLTTWPAILARFSHFQSSSYTMWRVGGIYTPQTAQCSYIADSCASQ